MTHFELMICAKAGVARLTWERIVGARRHGTPLPIAYTVLEREDLLQRYFRLPPKGILNFYVFSVAGGGVDGETWHLHGSMQLPGNVDQTDVQVKIRMSMVAGKIFLPLPLFEPPDAEYALVESERLTHETLFEYHHSFFTRP